MECGWSNLGSSAKSEVGEDLGGKWYQRHSGVAGLGLRRLSTRLALISENVWFLWKPRGRVGDVCIQ